MKILVAIANFGTKNDEYLSRVLAEYRSMPNPVDIVVTSNLPKDLGKDVEVLVGLPSKNPHSLPFAHRRVFAERKDAYDLFLYTEDDILITHRNIQAFLEATRLLPPEEIVGFFRWEQYPDGRRYYPEAHAFYRWMPDSVKVIGRHTFARFTNDHSGCYALTQSQLARAVDSGGFLVAPHEYKYGMLESAATDVYTQCGFRRLACLSHFEDFLVPHLPNRYVGSWMGLDAPDFQLQMEALPQVSGHARARDTLLEPETRAFHAEWSKDYYEPRRTDLLEAFPHGTRSVLSIGCGWGETEAELVRRGVEVTAVPLDPVIAACAEARNVPVLYGDLQSVVEQLRGKRFDGVLMSGILHLFPDPAKTLGWAGSLLVENGLLVATIPAFWRLPFRWQRLRHPSRFAGWAEFRRSGVQAISRRQLREWFREAGLSVERISGTIPKRWNRIRRWSRRLADELFASEYTCVGRRVANALRTAGESMTGEGESRQEMSGVAAKGSSR